MAITRAQQAKQLLANGGRIGLKGGADASMADFGTVTTPGVSKGRKGPGPKVGAGGASFNKDDNFQTLSTIDQDKVKEQKENYEKQFFDKGQVPPLGSRPTSFKTKLDQRNKQKRLNYINRLISNKRKKIIDAIELAGIEGVTEENFDELYNKGMLNIPSVADLVEQGFYKSDGPFATGEKIPGITSIRPPGFLGSLTKPFESPLTTEGIDNLLQQTIDLENLKTTEGIEGTTFNELMETYEPNRFKLMNQPDRDGPGPIDPCKGPNPPAYCFIGQNADDNMEAAVTRNLGGLTARIGGGLFNFDGPQFAADGGRIGLKGGADAATESFSKSAGSSRPGRKGSVNISSSGGVTFDPGGKDGGPDKSKTTFEQDVNQRRITNEAKKQKPSNLENMFKTASELNYLRNLIRMNPQGLGISYFTNKIGNFLFPPAGAAEFDMEAFQKAGAEKGFFGANDELEAMQEYYDAAKSLTAPGAKFAGANDPQAVRDFITKQSEIPFGGGSYSVDMDLVPKTFLETTEDFAKQKAPESFFAKGGIASLDREAFLLGGLAKGLKKAVRGVKKLAKSPIGKAALLGIGGGFMGIGPFKGLATAKGLGFKNFMLNKVLGTPLGDITGTRTGGLLGLIKDNPMTSIFLTSALAGAMTPKEDQGNDALAAYYAQNTLNPNAPLNKRIAGSDFYGGQLAADGGRIGYQEGSKEPVAKKTLPLIDMDGMEKDYRETGGFVEMGRMEKADDVPARLSKNEFVFTADAVRNAGEGDIDKGAEVMYNMMKNLEAGGEVSEESQGLEGAREMFQTSQRLGEVL